MSALQDSLIELIRRTSAEIPDDVQKAILDSLEREKKGTIAESALKIIERNIGLAKQKSQPICQDTGSIGMCIAGDRATGYEVTKRQYLRLLDDRNPVPDLDALEQDILKTANELGIGPMGFGGKATLLGVKICAVNRLPASFFVSVSYMCWAYRRLGATLNGAGEIVKWLY